LRSAALTNSPNGGVTLDKLVSINTLAGQVGVSSKRVRKDWIEGSTGRTAALRKELR